MPAIRVTPVYDLAMRGLCVKAYPLHPHGCPNFNAKGGCPPQAKRLPEIFDISRPFVAIYSIFDLDSHVGRMRAAHPRWSQRQLECCLYWQPGARKALRAEIAAWLRSPERRTLDPDLRMLVNACPEALGVNVTATMAAAGVELEWPPRTKTVQVALAGYPVP